MAKAKTQYPEDFKTMFGVAVMNLTQLLPVTLISSYLLLYITDYAGIYTGVAGKAAQVGALMLVIGRIWDAVNDPILGFIMDRAPRTKWGKFKPFMVWATPVSAILIIALFNIPASMSDVLKVAWLYIVYFLFDTVFTLMPSTPLIQTLTNKAEIRSKLLVAPRIVALVVSMAMSTFLAVAIKLGPDGITPNFGLTTLLYMVPLTAISLIGILLVKEGSTNMDEKKAAVKDAITMFRVNKPLLFAMLGYLCGGFIFNIFTSASVYYGKYAFGIEKFATLSIMLAAIMILTIIIGTVLSRYLIKWITPAVCILIAYATASVPLVIMFLINLAGPITSIPIYVSLTVLVFLGNSLAFIPWGVIFMECMDYNKFKMGISLQGIVSAMNGFIGKLQAAIGVALTGAVLVAIGYDAELYKDATAIPASLFSGLGFVLFALPAIFAILAIVVVLFYPLRKKEKRDQMYAEIEKHRAELEAASAGNTPSN